MLSLSVGPRCHPWAYFCIFEEHCTGERNDSPDKSAAFRQASREQNWAREKTSIQAKTRQTEHAMSDRKFSLANTPHSLGIADAFAKARDVAEASSQVLKYAALDAISYLAKLASSDVPIIPL
jgi:hypothetical protein